jgi:hypothetical protein
LRPPLMANPLPPSSPHLQWLTLELLRRVRRRDVTRPAPTVPQCPHQPASLEEPSASVCCPLVAVRRLGRIYMLAATDPLLQGACVLPARTYMDST